MKITIIKRRIDDAICITLDDGTEAHTCFPKKGPVPHDAVHYFVERELALSGGFWGTVASGMHPEDIAARSKAAGHASASRSTVPDASIVELIQAERLVECFEADLWGAGGSDEDLIAMARTGCAASYVCVPTIAEGAIGRIRATLSKFADDWRAAPEGHRAVFHWE